MPDPEKLARIRIPKGELGKEDDQQQRTLEIPESHPGFGFDPKPAPLPPPAPHHAKTFYRYWEKDEKGNERTGCHMVIYSDKKIDLAKKPNLGSKGGGHFYVQCINPKKDCGPGLSCDMAGTYDEAGDEILECRCKVKAGGVVPATPKKDDDKTKKTDGGNQPKKEDDSDKPKKDDKPGAPKKGKAPQKRR